VLDELLLLPTLEHELQELVRVAEPILTLALELFTFNLPAQLDLLHLFLGQIIGLNPRDNCLNLFNHF
jgi:hypothetical protein